MRRRLTIAIVATVVGALVLAGLGTLALARIGAKRYAEDELRRQVELVAESLSSDTAVLDLQDRPRILSALRDALRLEGVELVALTADGLPRGPLPDGVALSASELAALQAGETVSGGARREVFAAAVFERGESRTAIILSDRVDIVLGGAVLWFALAGLGVAAVGALVASRLARALTGPLRAAEEASRRIAAGDLAARVPEPRAGADDEVADLARSVNAMAAHLERARGLEQQFLLSVSHDLRTPLTSIQGYAEALADGTAPDAARAGEVILTESRRLNRLVRDLLELARLDSRSFTFRPAAVELDDLVAACADGFAPEAQATGRVLSVEARPAVVHADPDRLAQVVANLLENALRHAEREVRLGVAVADGRARVTVEDDGTGIGPVDLTHVFERLYVARHDPVRRETGSGLGLAIVRELVLAMGGTVGAEPSPSGGACLWFDLPVLDAVGMAAPPSG